jgi:hypothetical protein
MSEKQKIPYGFVCRNPSCGQFVLDQYVRDGEQPDTSRLTPVWMQCGRCGRENQFRPNDLQRSPSA